MPEITNVTQDHRLTVWLALQVFRQFVDHQSHYDSTTVVGPISKEEKDIAHYIGGCVIKKLQRKPSLSYEVLSSFVSEASPENDTLLYAKSRGKLTNITCDARAMFVELEQVYRDTFPSITDPVSKESQYVEACVNNIIIQSCFFNATYDIDTDNSQKETVFSKIIQFYFKIRVHHRCKIILDAVRARTKGSSKERSLRAKLAT